MPMPYNISEGMEHARIHVNIPPEPGEHGPVGKNACGERWEL